MENIFGYKCGEIYVNNSIYTYKCSFCSYNNKNIITLKKHLTQKHKNTIENLSTNKYSSTESIFNHEYIEHGTVKDEPIEAYSAKDLKLNSKNIKNEIVVICDQNNYEIDEDFADYINVEKLENDIEPFNANELEISSEKQSIIKIVKKSSKLKKTAERVQDIESIDDSLEHIFENDIIENSFNNVKDLKIEILFDPNTENLENCISPTLSIPLMEHEPPITRSQAKKLMLNDKYNSNNTNNSRNRRKLCTKCNRVSNDIYRHRKICSLKREWITCIYCGCHMFKETLQRHLNQKHSDKLNDTEQISSKIENDYNENNSNEKSNKSCKYCDRSVANILQHEINCIKSKKRVTCNVCGKHIFKRNINKHMDLHNHINNITKNILKHNKCRYCNREYHTRWGTIERHEKYCSNLMNREKCKYCKYSISKVNMSKHILNKHTDNDGNLKNILSKDFENYTEMDCKKLPCRYCNKLYLQPVLHEKHCIARTGYEQEWTRCQICSSLVQRRRLHIHMNKIHQIDIQNNTENKSTENIKTEFVKCILCGCHIILKNFQYHIFRIHKDRLPLKEHELLDYNKLSKLDLSEFRTTTIFSEWIKCKECGLMVAEPTLESHLDIHKMYGKYRGTNLQCNICKKKYPARRYQHHIRTAHLDETNSVFCNECALKRIHKDYYDEHLKWHRNEIIGYQCKICDRKFELKFSLDRHIKSHEETPSCECHECGKVFPNKLRLNQHVLIHSTDAKYQCDTCGKAFIIKSRLQSHQLTHMDKKFYRFPCTLCDKRFSGKAKLADHMITHTRTKNFKCEICDAKFARKFDAIKHQRRHTEVGHLMCSICERRFFLKRPLKDHLKSQHGILDENAIVDTRVQHITQEDTIYVTNLEIEDVNNIIVETERGYEIVMENDI